MRILIVSRTPWDNSNSFGNTFSNIFGGIQNVEIFNICCQAGRNNNSIVRQAYQMTDFSVLRSVFGNIPGHLVDQTDNSEYPPQKEPKLPHKRISVFYICRDIIWKLGKWKNDNLRSFITDVRPDIIYIPLYRSGYMIDVQNFVINCVDVPVVGHISDDIYNYPPDKFANPLRSIYQRYLRKRLRKIISKTAYLEVFSEDMISEYEDIFNKPIYLIGKGINVENIVTNQEYVKRDALHFVYTGNYGGERGAQLIALAQAIKEQLVNNGIKAFLDIYSTTNSESTINNELEKTGCVNFCGGVDSETVKHIQRQADFLIHVEGFSKRAIYETRLSFSTKIIDYLLAQRPILAIGPSEITSIKVLSMHGLATIANSIEDVPKAVNTITTSTYSPEASLRYLSKYRNIKNIHGEIYNRLKSISCTL